MIQGVSNSADGIRDFLEKNNIPTEYLDMAEKITKPFASQFGFDDTKIENMKSEFYGKEVPRTQPKKSGFDKGKYPRV